MPVLTTSKRSTPSCCATSSITAGVAVAVSARIVGWPSASGRASRSRGRLGRKSCPHCETQCASSTTSRLTGCADSAAMKSESASRSGVVKTIRARPSAIACSAAAISAALNALFSWTAANAELAELVALVLHQRDQRRDDQRDSGQQRSPAAGSTAICPRRSASSASVGRPASTCPMTASWPWRRVRIPKVWRSVRWIAARSIQGAEFFRWVRRRTEGAAAATSSEGLAWGSGSGVS